MAEKRITYIYEGEGVHTIAADSGNYASLHLKAETEGYIFKGYSYQATVIGRDCNPDLPKIAQPLLTLRTESDLDDLITILQGIKEQLEITRATKPT